ncbi:L-2-hydroxyglutarate oxidase [Actinomadura spongiicola]|uniref:L-2-hydroxyglutarate oxidase n=1 Tax=Actinomadura spongiicola TaxID=2303421 RepID=A0A372GHW2_9ACTN|nr:L-2-hydroxyglutarate oxidase [Actinomadura spongiicola]RFS84960.1 L-2-hydroxyglutarate oxidase [Actinomadura spongiicola]
MADVQVGVVGAGIVGLAIARRLARTRPDLRVTVLEKEDRVAVHQTGRNSGVAHAGLYYAPGSLKATLCRRGIVKLREYCHDRNLPYVECGKIVVARSAAELAALDEIERRATANGVPGLRRLTPGGLREIEPHAAGIAALHSPTTAITDFGAVARAFADDVVAAGGELRFGFEVERLNRTGDRVTAVSPHDRVTFDRLVICAGLHSDRVARLAGDTAAPAIVPFRGEYLRLLPSRTDLVRGLIYPVPDPRYPFLGVHFTRRVDGGVDIGPNAVLALAREGYRWRDVRPADVWETVRWPGFRRLAREHWRTGARELYGSAVRRAFIKEARSFVPELAPSDVVRAPAGVRAQAVDPDGSLVDDFRITRIGPIVSLRNAPSPAATSSLAIAEHVTATL